MSLKSFVIILYTVLAGLPAHRVGVNCGFTCFALLAMFVWMMVKILATILILHPVSFSCMVFARAF